MNNYSEKHNISRYNISIIKQMVIIVRSKLKLIKDLVLRNRKIEKYKKNLKSNEEFKVIFGGHWSNHPGWLILNENEQDIRERIRLPDDSVDVIFNEHTIEHIDMNEGIFFMSESKRILKEGGTLRIISPMIDRLLSVSFEDDNGKKFVQNSLCHLYHKENDTLSKLHLNGVDKFAQCFLLNSIFREYGHKFIWSSELMINVLKVLGFRSAKRYEIGRGNKEEYCIERRRRGLYGGCDYKKDMLPGYVYDPESVVIEAVK